MAKNTKTTHRVYSAWNYEKEIEDLNRESEQGWQLVKGGCFRSKFSYDPDVRYRYQLDYRKIDDMPRYLETFREQGWEYVSSTFNGWHYFRKLYDPSLPEESYVIFSDQQSKQEMNGRWAILAMVIGLLIGIMAIIFAIRMIRTPNLPTLVQLITFAVECFILMRGARIMSDPSASRNRQGDRKILAIFFAVIAIGTISNLILTGQRPHVNANSQAADLSEPMKDNQMGGFHISYPDYYYLDLSIDAKAPLTFQVLSEGGEEVYSVTETGFRQENIRLKLPRGDYSFSMSCEAGYDVSCNLD